MNTDLYRGHIEQIQQAQAAVVEQASRLGVRSLDAKTREAMSSGAAWILPTVVVLIVFVGVFVGLHFW